MESRHPPLGVWLDSVKSDHSFAKYTQTDQNEEENGGEEEDQQPKGKVSQSKVRSMGGEEGGEKVKIGDEKSGPN